MKPSKLRGYIPLLRNIQAAVLELEKYDRDGGYGDMAQNFETFERVPLTDELIEMVKEDLKQTKGE